MAGHILVIDDDSAIRSLLTEVLSDEGYRVQAVGTAADGLRAVKRDRPSLIFLDMRMPDDGPRFKKELGDRADGARIVATSAGPEGRAWALAMGARFLPKPFDVESVLAAARGSIAEQHTTTSDPDG